MKVAHIITRLILGGAQENTVYSCIDLARRHGATVRLFTGPTTGPEGSLVKFAKEQGVDLVEIPALIRAINPLYDVPAYFQIRRALKEFSPDVVHTHSAKAGILGRAAASSLKIPAIVHTIHGAPWYPAGNVVSRKFNQICEKWAAKRCHKLVSVADAMTQLFLDAHIAPADKFTTIYSGMDVEPFLNSAPLRESTRNEYGFQPDDVVIGKIARLFRLKGHDDLIAAARIVCDKNDKVKFLLVGDGILRKRLEESVRSAGLTDRFVFAGLVPAQRIPAMISAMDVVVHTSLREGLARVAPQALISGKPVVSYDVDGAREVVITDETGCLIPPGDINRLADALTDLSNDPEKRTRFGRVGRERFTNQFKREIMADRLMELYQTLLPDAVDR